MTMLSRFNCSPRLIVSVVACAIYLPFLAFRLHGLRGFHFDRRLVAQRANHFEAAGDDLVAFIQAAQNFDVGGAGDSGLDLAEDGLLSGDDEHSLNLLLERLDRK